MPEVVLVGLRMQLSATLALLFNLRLDSRRGALALTDDVPLSRADGFERSQPARLGKLGRPLRTARGCGRQALLLGESSGRVERHDKPRQHARALGGPFAERFSRAAGLVRQAV